jgi:hypothetical protein
MLENEIIPIAIIALFIVVTQTFAWTRDNTQGLFPSERTSDICTACFLDVLFAFLVSGIWLI